VISCEGVSFSYPDGTVALHEVDLSIHAGERVALVGPNGSGKTTLVRLWNGLLRPGAGTVTIHGRSVEGRRVADLARTVGMTFQDPGAQLFASTCRAEVAFGARIDGQSGSGLSRAVEASLDAVGLRDAGGSNPYDLGRSGRRMLALACVVAMRTQVVVLDEPSIGLDHEERARLQAVLDALMSEGRTLVVITHDPRLVDASPHVIRLEAGRVVSDGPPGRREQALSV
jgi:energy-coupling factor transporter ATP-binding protein EcfA2